MDASSGGQSGRGSFEFLGRFGRVHHRALNALGELEALAARPVSGEIVDVAEGDICWYESNGEVLAVLHHPDMGFRLPDRSWAEDAIARGAMPTLDDVLAPRFSGIPKVFELKVGAGDVGVALEHIVKRVSAASQRGWWFDAFSPRLLRLVKALDPEALTSLHTRIGVYGPYFVKTAFEPVPVSILPVASLRYADAVTITYKNCPARWLAPFGVSVDGVHRSVLDAGKALIFGGVESPRVEEILMRTRARAAYRKWK